MKQTKKKQWIILLASAILMLLMSVTAFGEQFIPLKISRPMDVPNLISQGKGMVFYTSASELSYSMSFAERGWLIERVSNAEVSFFTDPQMTSQIFPENGDFGDGQNDYRYTYVDAGTYYGKAEIFGAPDFSGSMYSFFLPCSAVLQISTSVSGGKATLTCATNGIDRSAATTNFRFSLGNRTVKDILDEDNFPHKNSNYSISVTENTTYSVRVHSTVKEWDLFPVDVPVTVSGISPEIKMEPVLAENITLNGARTELKAGQSLQLSASADPVNTTYLDYVWSVDKPDFASITQNGLLTAKTAGIGKTVWITVKIKDRRTGEAYKEDSGWIEIIDPNIYVDSIRLNNIPDSKSVYYGKTLKLSATVLPTNATNGKLEWISSNPDYATVSADGLVTPQENGIGHDVYIKAKATDGTGIEDGFWLDILDPNIYVESITLKNIPDSKSVYFGKTLQLSAVVLPTNVTNGKLEWISSNPDYATVSADGLVTPTEIGIGHDVYIKAKATDGTGQEDGFWLDILDPNVYVTDVTISGGDRTVEVGSTVQLSASVLPGNATDKTLTWTSSNPAYAEVDANGLVTPTEAGAGETVTITAKSNDKNGESASINLEIKEKTVYVTALTITGASSSLTEKGTMKLKAVITPEEVTDDTIIWKSSKAAYASVNEDGLVTAYSKGVGKTVTITAIAADQKKVKASVKIKIVKDVKFNENNPKVVTYKAKKNANGNTYQLKIDNCTSKAQIKNLKSSKVAVATVKAGKGFISVTVKKTGKVKITATVQGKALSTTLTVKKYSTPVASFLVGNTKYTSSYKTTDILTLGKKVSKQKVTVKLKSGWKIARVETTRSGKTTKKKVNKQNWTGKVTLPGKKDGIVLVCVNASKKITETISLQTFIKAK